MNNVCKKQPNESIEEYIFRICSLKDKLDLTWEEIAFVINQQTNKDLSERTYRRKFNEMSRASLSSQIEDEVDYDDELLAIKKERIKLKDELSQINNLIRLDAREEYMRETAIDAAIEAAKIKPLKFEDKIKIHKSSNKIGILAIGDWHYGIDINVFHNTYNTDICRSRVEKLANKVLDIVKKEGINSLYVINLGDMISGRIHLQLRVNSRTDVVTQTMEVAELIAEFIHKLSEFVTVTYGSVSDNHSRIEPKKKESLQAESFSRIIDWYLDERLSHNPNTRMIKNKYGEDIFTLELFDYKIAAVHGDKDKVGKVITNLNMFTQEHLDLILTAHTHHFSADESNETLRLCNGSLMGCDDYASDLRLNSKPSQLFIVASEESVTECIYKLDVK